MEDPLDGCQMKTPLPCSVSDVLALDPLEVVAYFGWAVELVIFGQWTNVIGFLSKQCLFFSFFVVSFMIYWKVAFSIRIPYVFSR